MNSCTPELDPVDHLRSEAGHLLVRRAVDRSDWISDAILDIAAGQRVHWTPQDWNTLLTDLRRSPGSLADWLDLNT